MTCASPGPLKSVALPVFHAFTGCDTVSQFAQVEEKTAWKVWATHDEFTATFCELHNSPQQMSEETEAALEYCTILLYDRTVTCTSINEVGKLLFTHKGHQMSALPPTKATLQQHIRWAILQSGHIWASTMLPYRQMPSLADWGWTCPEQWKPLWTQMPEARVSCPDLLKCACRSRCRDFKCVKVYLKCSVCCTCKRDCDNAWNVARVYRQSSGDNIEAYLKMAILTLNVLPSRSSCNVLIRCE